MCGTKAVFSNAIGLKTGIHFDHFCLGIRYFVYKERFLPRQHWHICSPHMAAWHGPFLVSSRI